MGGTVANPPNEPGYLSGTELVESAPELSEIAEMSVVDVRRKSSSSIDFSDWIALQEQVDRVLETGDTDGIVVTLGSNATAETAYFLDLTLGTEVPIALTAAQRNFGTPGSDGQRNLLDAVRTVVEPAARSRGVLVVLNDQIHAARDVTKVVSGRPDAWESGDFGPLGLVDKYGYVEFYCRPERVHTDEPPFIVPGDDDGFPTVEIVYSSVDNDGSMVDAALEGGADGLVLAAFPTGAVSKRDGRSDQQSAVERAADVDIPVVIAHRGTEGWPASTYRQDSEVVWGDTLRPEKARILLTLALTQTDELPDIQTMFETH